MRGALGAADAGLLVREALADSAIAAILRSAKAIDVVAVGKAAGPMLRALTEHGQVSLRRARAITPADAAHPVPDERSIAAARDILGVAAAASESDLLVLLLSGGASSLMALPADGITLGDKQRASRVLLERGAAIQELNTVRKHLSAIKGGQLAAATSGAVLTLAVSDVVGDDLSAIGSGPAVPDATTFAMALAVLDRHGGREAYPASCVERLERGAAGGVPETPKPGDPRLARAVARVIGGRHHAMDGARAAAELRGYVVHVIEAPVVGEARIAGPALVETARHLVVSGFSRKERPLCIISSGETTVHVTGSGKGGRNQECALAMAGSLHTLGDMVVAASIGTDGIDGPTDAAGGLVDSTTPSRAATAHLGLPELYLNSNDAYQYLDALNDLIKIGPTDTNVGDLQVILVGRW